MDGDPSVEPELDAFSRALPLPYRVALITVLATWGWGANLHYLYRCNIDVPALIRYPGRSSAAHAPHHASAYRLAGTASALLAASLQLFWVLTRGAPERVLALDWLPMATLAVLGVVLVFPLQLGALVGWLPGLLRRRRRMGAAVSILPGGLARSTPAWARPPALPQDGRRRFAATLRRVAVGGLAETQHGRFGDILLADVLTSYSKVLGDLYVVVCMFFFTSRAGREASATDRPDRSCGGAVVVPLILAAPFAARLRQCLIEHGRARRAGQPARQHAANAGKYATSFPVILFSALQRRRDGGPASVVFYRLWLAAVVVNSFYSFYWDVARDWDLTLFERAAAAGAAPARSPARSPSPAQAQPLLEAEAGGLDAFDAPRPAPWGLRGRLLLGGGRPALYYAAIALDLVLRCTWSLKLSPHLDHVADFESSLFLMQLLEVARRWVWIFFRVETEWLRTAPGAGGASMGGSVGGSASVSGSMAGGSASSSTADILLGEYPKYDDEE